MSHGLLRRTRSARLTIWACGLAGAAMLAGCGGKEPSPKELEAVNAVRKLGGRVTQRGQRHTEVILGGTKVTDADLLILTDLPDLELLNLQNTGITDGGMVYVGALDNLQRLSLQRSKVTDAGLEHLAKLKSLVELDLVGLPITDAGLEHLHGLLKLEKVYFDRNRVSPEAVRSLKDALPNAQVFAD